MTTATRSRTARRANGLSNASTRVWAQWSYLFGERKALADIAIAPFVRQFALADWDWFFAQPYPHVQRWLDDFITTAPFTAVMDKHDPWRPGDAGTLITAPHRQT